MKKRIVLFSALAAMGMVASSQAVVIHWAVTTPETGTTSARLVYVSDGNAPTYTQVGGVSGNGTELATVTTVVPSGIGEQGTTFTPDPSAGGYYVVLFDGAGNYSVSSSMLAWDNTASITANEMTPASQVFDPGFTGWTAIPVPEPATGALFCIGGAILAWRRRKRK